ncbi:hypothetical protein X973_15170, partial [Piscirickettsia salmonis]
MVGIGDREHARKAQVRHRRIAAQDAGPKARQIGDEVAQAFVVGDQLSARPGQGLRRQRPGAGRRPVRQVGRF